MIGSAKSPAFPVAQGKRGFFDARFSRVFTIGAGRMAGRATGPRPVRERRGQLAGYVPGRPAGGDGS